MCPHLSIWILCKTAALSLKKKQKFKKTKTPNNGFILAPPHIPTPFGSPTAVKKSQSCLQIPWQDREWPTKRKQHMAGLFFAREMQNSGFVQCPHRPTCLPPCCRHPKQWHFHEACPAWSCSQRDLWSPSTSGLTTSFLNCNCSEQFRNAYGFFLARNFFS